MGAPDGHGISGWSGGGGWRIRTPHDDPRGVEFASAHESHHRQLANSTTFGGLTAILTKPVDVPGRGVASSMVAVSRQIHEAFATWAPATALGWTLDKLTGAYPSYARHYNAMQSLVGPFESPYLRLHVAHAIARACLQTTCVETALTVGLDRFSLADIRVTGHPDRRFEVIRRVGLNRDLLTGEVERVVGGDHGWSETASSPALTADMLSPERTGLWEIVNRTVYAHVCDLLREAGCDTLGHDDQLLWLQRLADAADAGRGNLPTSRETRVVPRTIRVLDNIEAEGFEVGQQLRARVLPPDTALHEMVVGPEDPHLFLTIRRRAELLGSYVLDQRYEQDAKHGPVAVVRRAVPDGSGRLEIELLDVTTTMPPRSQSPAPVVTVAALSLLQSPLATRFAEYLHPELSLLLLDLPLGRHLELWLAQAGSRFRYAFVRTEARGLVVPLLVGVFQSGEARSHLMIRPLSHAAVGIFRAAFEELDIAGEQIVADPDVLQLQPELLHLGLSHLVGEEIQFSASWP